jgi:hypothetical protein
MMRDGRRPAAGLAPEIESFFARLSDNFAWIVRSIAKSDQRIHRCCSYHVIDRSLHRTILLQEIKESDS